MRLSPRKKVRLGRSPGNKYVGVRLSPRKKKNYYWSDPDVRQGPGLKKFMQMTTLPNEGGHSQNVSLGVIPSSKTIKNYDLAVLQTLCSLSQPDKLIFVQIRLLLTPNVHYMRLLRVLFCSAFSMWSRQSKQTPDWVYSTTSK